MKKIMSIFSSIFLIIIFNSCKKDLETNQTLNLQQNPESSIKLKGKSFLKIGQKISDLDADFSFSLDSNGLHSESTEIKDYYSTDSDFSVNCSDSSTLNGIIFFSTETKSDKIIEISANWTLQNSDSIFICPQLHEIFPILKNEKLIENWHKSYNSEFQTEHFNLTRTEISNEWLLTYKLVPK